MITIEDVLSDENQALALDSLSIKPNGAGIDRMLLSELREFWKLNKDRIIEEIYEFKYQPGLIMEYEIINDKGKRRLVNRYNSIDRFITRMISQKLADYFEPIFLESSHAYQNNKGIQTAVEQARDYIEASDSYVVELDILHFF